MAKIKKIKGRQVFDSRGQPTVEAEVYSDKGNYSSAIIPSGASTGTHEAFELRDKENKKYLGKSVLKAIDNINGPIAKALNNTDINNQVEIDKILIDLDGTEQKKKLGANAILAASIASCKLAAVEKNISLFKNITNSKSYNLPVPLLNIINGGVHAKNNLDIQEFMIRPDRANSFSEAMRMSFLVIQNLKTMLDNTNVGDEGGFAPNLKNEEEAIQLIIEAIEKSGFEPGIDISICLDVAANELSKAKNIDYYSKLINKYPIKSIEDPFSEDDWESWKKLTKSTNIQIVGDDLFATNIKRLKRGIQEKSANSILVKLNQIGTVSETIDVINLAQTNGFKTIISHRSGDSEDTFIADLAVATNSTQIKTGSLARSERVAKYNRLLRIEDELGNSGKIAKV
ncbi:MAG: phosphopyruvate hydratase [Candidatus Pelagibacterales bacterium]|nr:MAG: phosphopyruvate hydratase [Pelagibacterales bacterium]